MRACVCVYVPLWLGVLVWLKFAGATNCCCHDNISLVEQTSFGSLKSSRLARKWKNNTDTSKFLLFLCTTFQFHIFVLQNNSYSHVRLPRDLVLSDRIEQFQVNCFKHKTNHLTLHLFMLFFCRYVLIYYLILLHFFYPLRTRCNMF